MYEVTERRRKLDDGTEITTYTRDVIKAFGSGLNISPCA